MNKYKSSFSLSVFLATLFVACWQLPKDFAALPLSEKVDVYGARFEHGGARSIYAENLIVLHGYSAAESMVPYIIGRKEGIPKFVAINIVWEVQSRGCDLRSSTAAIAINDLVRGGHAQADEAIAAEGALDAINNNRHSDAASRGLPADVCKPPQEGRR